VAEDDLEMRIYFHFRSTQRLSGRERLMSSKVAQWSYIALFLIACTPVAVFAREMDPKVQGGKVLEQARGALGGYQALSLVRSISASGDFRSGPNNAEVSGDVQLDILFPDKLMRTMNYSPVQTTKVTSTEIMNDGSVWTNSQSKPAGPLMEGGSVSGIGMGRWHLQKPE
jgi:hypothetical protein